MDLRSAFILVLTGLGGLLTGIGLLACMFLVERESSISKIQEGTRPSNSEWRDSEEEEDTPTNRFMHYPWGVQRSDDALGNFQNIRIPLVTDGEEELQETPFPQEPHSIQPEETMSTSGTSISSEVVVSFRVTRTTNTEVDQFDKILRDPPECVVAINFEHNLVFLLNGRTGRRVKQTLSRMHEVEVNLNRTRKPVLEMIFKRYTEDSLGAEDRLTRPRRILDLDV